MEEEKKVFKRVQLPKQLWLLPFVVVLGAVMMIAGIAWIISGTGNNVELLAVGIFILIMGTLCVVVLPFPLTKEVKMVKLSNSYPEEAVIVYGTNIDIITDKTESFYFDQIKSVRSIRVVAPGVFYNKILTYGTLFIKLKEGRRITLRGIDNVSVLSKMIKSKLI